MATEIMCNTFQELYQIIENTLTTPSTKKVEKAVCPKCGNELLSKEIDGWFTVSRTGSEKHTFNCKYPMP